jgi:hypothetical protein
MLLIRLRVSVLLVTTLSAFAQQNSCPRVQHDSPLKTVEVFDGPVEEMAELKPDISKGQGVHIRSIWNVGYVFDQGRTLYVLCKYQQSVAPVKINIQRKVDACTFIAGSSKKPAELVCK